MEVWRWDLLLLILLTDCTLNVAAFNFTYGDTSMTRETESLASASIIGEDKSTLIEVGFQATTSESVPETAKDVRIMAVRKNELNVYWTIANLTIGTLSSSRAIAILNDKEVSQCSSTAAPHACVLSQLNHSTEYRIVIEVCVSTLDSLSSQNSSADWCSTTTGVQKKTLREFPARAEDVRILAVRTNELNVSWTIPDMADGKLASSRAIVILNEKEVTFCFANGPKFTCVLSQLNHSTEYSIVIEVCVTPPDAVSIRESGAAWCSKTATMRKTTLPEYPETAKDVRILAVRKNELNVYWTIPKLTFGTLSSSRVIAILKEKEVSQCSSTAVPHACVLSQLNHSTAYRVVIEVCVTPPDAVSSHDANPAWCSTTTGVQKKTLREVPARVEDVRILAVRTNELNVSWTIPDLEDGKIASSRAIAILHRKEVTFCSANGPRSSCILSQLNHSTEYIIVIEVCVTPPDAVSSQDYNPAWCSTTTGVQKKTLREFPARAEDVRILAVRTNELNVSWTIPDLLGGKLASSRAMGMLGDFVAMQCTPEVTMDHLAACLLSGMAHSTEYKVFIELCVTPLDAMSPQISIPAWCSKTDGLRKRTLPQSPENATSVTVRAVQCEALTVSWINPNSVYGKLVSATATASLHTQTTVVANCWLKDVCPGAATCTLSGLKDFTLYDVLVKVCICPKDAVHLDCLSDAWCSESTRVGKRTLPGVPDSATVVRVQSRRKNSLSVYWTNPTAAHGVLASSKAIAILNNKTEGGCSGIPEAASLTSCSINGLKDFTTYTVRVLICVLPVEAEPGYLAGGGCSSTSPIVKQTLPGGPDIATITAVLARQRNSLEVSWINPDATHGPLANATAIGFWRGKKLATCQADILPGQVVNCTLTKLMDFEEYAISVEVCVAPAQAEFDDGCDGGGGCSRTISILGSTLPGVFSAGHLAVLGKEIPNSKQIVEDPSTQISIKVALSSLPIEQVGPVFYVTAYVEPPNQTELEPSRHQLARNRRSAEIFSFLSGSYNNKTWEPWEVLIRNFQGDSSYKIEDFFFTIGQPSDTQVCDNCYNGPLAPDTVYRVGLRVYTQTGAGTTELSVFKTAPAPISSGLVVGITSACLLILAAIAFTVYLFVHKTGRDTMRNDRHRLFVGYKQKEIPSWDRSEIPLPIAFADFNLRVKRMQSDAEAMHEFLTLGHLTNKQILEYELTENLASTVPKLNRYGDMTPYDQSIVRLDHNWVAYYANQHPLGPLQSKVLDVYVNANYVKACHYDSRGQAQIPSGSSLPEYIATQGPLTHTQADFLYMIHQQRVPIVITLCNILEGGASKCAQYWPDSSGITEEKGNHMRSVDVTLNHETRAANVITRSMTVKPERESKSWTFTQLHFLSWADHAVPPIAEFYDFLKEYAFLRKQKPLSRAFGPTVVHCSAGVGRTGTLISAQILLDQLRTNPQTIDIFGTVLAVRVFRKRLVQVMEQFRFLYDFLAYCIREEGITGIIDPLCNQTTLQPRLLPLQFPTPLEPPPAYISPENPEASRSADAPTQSIPLQPLSLKYPSPLTSQEVSVQASDFCVDAPGELGSPSYRQEPQLDLKSESFQTHPSAMPLGFNPKLE